MIRPVDPRPQVLGRGHAHELPELLREVRLVSVTVPRGHGRPVDLSPPVEITNHPLQPLHPGEALGTETDLLVGPASIAPGTRLTWPVSPNERNSSRFRLTHRLVDVTRSAETEAREVAHHD